MGSPPLDHRFMLSELMLMAGEEAGRRIRLARRKRLPAYTVPKRKPGPDTPMWNVVVESLRPELQMRGTKARLARHLGLPRQRVTDFVRGRRRLPDAETLLQILFWLHERQAGRDPSR